MSEKEAKQIHSGHRDRVKQKFRDNSLDNFADHEILEFLLFYTIPRQDTNPIGHALMNKYKYLSRVFDAKFGDLLDVPGISTQSATLIKLIPALCRRYMLDKQNLELTHLSGHAITLEYVKSLFIGKTYEELYMLCLNKLNKVLSVTCLSKGQLESTPVDLREVARIAANSNASRVIIAHNHPSGIPLPSISDMQATERIKNFLNSMSIELNDHIIVTDTEVVSMQAMGMFEKMEERARKNSGL